MPLINTSVPNLIQGVSQQPDATRFDGQCEEQENALSSVAEGLKKRPNTRHIARLLTSAISSNAKVHFINRSEEEKYVVIHDGSLRIFNLGTGVEATITGSASYINSSTPKDDIEFTTVTDYTFILNKTKTVLARSALSPAVHTRPYIFIKQGGYSMSYDIRLNNTSYIARTGDSGFTSVGGFPEKSAKAGFARDLFFQSSVPDGAAQVADLSSFAVKHGLTGIYFNNTTTVNSISVTSDLNDQGIGLVYKEVEAITDLPIFCINALKVKVRGDVNLNEDDYYVKFETVDGTSAGNGAWIETSGDEVSLGLNTSTMPHQLVNTGVNTFTLQTGTFDERQAGDDESNPHPSFVGKKIKSIFFHKNRLGYLSDDSVSFSVAGHFFNHYRATVATLLDDAPIDVSVASTKVTELKHAVGFQGDLILFSDNSQFVLKGSDLLTSKTVSISAVTSFSAGQAVQPLPLGSYIYFPFSRGNFTGINEYSTSTTTDTFEATEITEHVPAYVPSNLIQMKGTTSEDLIALVSGNDPSCAYIYNYFWNTNQKVLSAWSKFTFTGEIRGMEFIESTLYAVITNNDETNLVEMPLESGLSDDAGYVTHLDMRVANTVTNGSSTITLPYTPEDDSVQVYTTDGLALNCTNSGSTVTLSSPVSSNTDVWVGIPYTMKYTFSEQLFKAKAGNGKSPSNAAKMMVRNGSLYYADSAYFKVKVTPKYRDTYVNIFTPDVVGSSTLGSLSLDSGFYRFPVFTKPQDTTITIENESALPSTFQSAEFESFVHSRSNRYG
jgi:hypothetical protein